jgi:D-alanyl-D-alanine carboxypeptidase
MRLNNLLVATTVALTLAFNCGTADAARSKSKTRAKPTQPAKPLATAAGAAAVFVCVATPQPEQDCLQLDDPQFNREIDKLIAPASLVKLMTAYMVYKHALNNGKSLDDHFITLNEQDRIDGRMGLKNGKHADFGGYSPRELGAGLRLTYRDAILAMTAFSANNVAVASGKAIGGSEANFAEMMTSQLRHLGLEKTTFKNASGMPWDGQITTAREMARLLNFIVADLGTETFGQLYGNQNARIAGQALHKGRQEIGNSIRFLKHDDLNIVGAKTGTMSRLSNIAFYSLQNGVGTITIILGSPNGTVRDNLALQVMRRATEAIIPSAQAATPAASAAASAPAPR